MFSKAARLFKEPSTIHTCSEILWSKRRLLQGIGSVGPAGPCCPCWLVWSYLSEQSDPKFDNFAWFSNVNHHFLSWNSLDGKFPILRERQISPSPSEHPLGVYTQISEKPDVSCVSNGGPVTAQHQKGMPHCCDDRPPPGAWQPLQPPVWSWGFHGPQNMVVFNSSNDPALLGCIILTHLDWGWGQKLSTTMIPPASSTPAAGLPTVPFFVQRQLYSLQPTGAATVPAGKTSDLSWCTHQCLFKVGPKRTQHGLVPLPNSLTLRCTWSVKVR